MMNHTRSRWAAIGAAVAVSLGAGGIGISHATTDTGPMPIFKPLDAPCRLADTRPAPNTVGPRTAGVGPAETYDLDGWGASGDCTLPSDTAALQLNVTAVGATQQTNLRFFPKGATLPTTANLNPSPGASPTPNSVVVGLNATDGQFSVYNAFGTVAVIIDVIGYFDDHVHTGDDIVDESLTGDDVEDETLSGDDIQNNSVSNLDTSNEPGVTHAFSTTSVTLNDATVKRVGATFMRVPSDGYVVVEASGNFAGASAGADLAGCQITKNAAEGTALNAIGASREPATWLNDKGDNVITGFSTHRVLEVAVADNPALLFAGQTFALDCLRVAGTVNVVDTHISATFYPSSYAPLVIVLPLDEEG